MSKHSQDWSTRCDVGLVLIRKAIVLQDKVPSTRRERIWHLRMKAGLHKEHGSNHMKCLEWFEIWASQAFTRYSSRLWATYIFFFVGQ